MLELNMPASYLNKSEARFIISFQLTQNGAYNLLLADAFPVHLLYLHGDEDIKN